MPEKADIAALVEIGLKRLLWAPKDGILWLEGNQVTCGSWHFEAGHRSSEVLERIFQGSLRDFTWKWSSAMYEMHFWDAGKLYRIKFQGASDISEVAQDAASSIDLPALKLVAIAEQIMDIHRVKGIRHAWETALNAASGSLPD